MRFDELIDAATALLRARKRISARAIRLQFSLDDETAEALCAELVDVVGVATQVDGILEWRGEKSVAPRIESERRLITVMFCDLVGSTSLAGRLDPEDFHTVVRAYQTHAAEVVERFDGYIAQYLGDGVLVYFGWPIAHEDDAARAVSAAMGLVEAVARLADDLAARGLPRIEARVGVHTGAVVVGEVGAGKRFESLALGETPNLCARLQGEARPGGVVISEDTKRLVEGFFRFKDLGPRELRGIARHVGVYEVEGASGARGRIDVAASRGLAPLVDREKEREALTKAFDAARSGKRTAVLLRGEAGIGKSRLQHYVKQSLATGDRAEFECRGSPYHANTALHPISEAMRLVWELDTTTDPFARIDAVVREYDIAPLDESRALLAGLTGVTLRNEHMAPIAGWTPQRQRQRTFALLVEILRREAMRRPVLFMVEDLHWVDPSTLEFVDALFEGASGAAVLLLMTSRPEIAWSLEGRPDAVSLDLPRLGRDHTAELLRHVAGDTALSPDITLRLAERTEGVPLFIEELTRTVVESAEIARNEEPTIPSSLYGSLMARLDRLDVVRAVAQLGAALGRTFTRPLLRAVSDLPDAALDDGLEQAVHAQILHRVGSGDAVVYSFRHALVQEAALQSVLKRTLQQSHQRIADTLVARFPQIAQKEPESVAKHYTDGEVWPLAIEWWLKAGYAAIARFANAEAIAHLSRALSLVPQLPEAQRDANELMLRVLYAIPLTMTRGWAAPDVGAQYRRAEELCAKVGETPQLFPTLVGLLTYYIVCGQFDRAAEMAVRNLAVAEQARDVELRLEAHHDRGTTTFYLGRLNDAHVELERCIELYVPEKHHHHVLLYGKDPGAVARVHLGLAHALRGNVKRAREVAEAAVSLTDTWVHPFSHLWALCGRAAVCEVFLDTDLALATAEEVVAQSQTQGFPNWLAQGLCYLGHGLATKGKTAEGIEQLRKGIGIWDATGAQLLQPFLRTLLADALLLHGNAASARVEIAHAIALAEKHQEKWYYAEQLRLRAELEEDPAAAMVWLDRAEADARSRGARLLELRAVTSIVKRGRDAHARSRLATLLEAFDASSDDCAPIREARAQLQAQSQ